MRNPLLLREVLDHVLDHLDAPYYALQLQGGPEDTTTGITVHQPCGEPRKALFSLARTCRAISEPSLDRLWRSLGSIAPIARLFVIVQSKDGNYTVIPPSPAEWANIHKYTIRVKELFVLQHIYLMPDSIESFMRYMPQLPPIFSDPASSGTLRLLPNLKVLVCGMAHQNLMPLVERLLVPELVSLDMTFSGFMNSPRPLFDRFAVLCPNLKMFRWYFLGYQVSEEEIVHPDIVNALSSFVRRLEKLQGLEILLPFDHITLKRLILSPNLKALGIMLDHPCSEVEKIGVTVAHTPFPNVETIKVKFWDLYVLASLLRPHRQHFRSVDLTLHSDWVRPSAESLHVCFTALATPQRAGSLESFVFCVYETDWEDIEDTSELEDTPAMYCLSFETLSPLAEFHNLLTLRIALPNQISIDDDELATLARSWPALKILRLNCRSGGWPYSLAQYPTLRGFLALVEACPRLWSVYLPIDARVFPMDPGSDICSTAVLSVGFPDGLITDPRQVAEFIRKHLPSVKHLYPESWKFTSTGGAAEYLAGCRQLWLEVQKMLIS